MEVAELKDGKVFAGNTSMFPWKMALSVNSMSLELKCVGKFLRTGVKLTPLETVRAFPRENEDLASLAPTKRGSLVNVLRTSTITISAQARRDRPASHFQHIAPPQ